MNDDGTDVVRMRLEACDFLAGVVVVYPQLEVIAAAHDPVLPGDKTAGSDRDVGKLEGLDDLLGIVRPDVDVPRVEGRQDPVFGRVKVDTLHPLAASEELPLPVGVMLAEGTAWLGG